MALTKGSFLQPQSLTTVERDLLRLTGADVGRLIYNETLSVMQQWSGIAWENYHAGYIDGSWLINELDGGSY